MTTEKFRNAHGFALIELLVAIGIMAILTAIAIPVYSNYNEQAKVVRAIAEISTLQKEIAIFQLEWDRLPNSLNEIGRQSHLDPWKNPYQYLNFANVKGKGNLRKDRFLVPLNSAYDLYSMGKDGQSKPPLTANASRDDIIRADDGGYIGLALKY